MNSMNINELQTRWTKHNRQFIGHYQYTFDKDDLKYATKEAKQQYAHLQQEAEKHGKVLIFERYHIEKSGLQEKRDGTIILNSWNNLAFIGYVNDVLVTTSPVIWNGHDWIKTLSGSLYKIQQKKQEK